MLYHEQEQLEMSWLIQCHIDHGMYEFSIAFNII